MFWDAAAWLAVPPVSVTKHICLTFWIKFHHIFLTKDVRTVKNKIKGRREPMQKIIVIFTALEGTHNVLHIMSKRKQHCLIKDTKQIGYCRNHITVASSIM